MRTAHSLVGTALSLALACSFGCDGSSGNASGGSAAPTNTGGPTSIYGKSAQMGKDVRKQIEQTSEQANQQAAAMTGTGSHTEIGGLKWAVPATWEKAPTSSSMRIAEFNAGGVNIRFFAIGGPVQQNLTRWRGQVANPIKGPESREMTAAGGALKVHLLKVTGTYAGMGPSGAPVPPQDNTRFLGAIIEGAPQPIQVVATGPADQVEDMEKAWEMMLAGVLMR
ncbi:MAG: hypothetical protein AB7K52_03285 [Phycisphaerales bacterium]